MTVVANLFHKHDKDMEKLVIGIDFSKETMNYCCLQGSAVEVRCEGVVENSKAGCREMVRQLRSLLKGLRVTDFLFCGEQTGVYSLEVASYLVSRHYMVWLESPLQIKLSSGIRRQKTDPSDARMIAEYAFRHQDKAKAFKPSSKALAELKVWMKTHEALTKIKVSLQNQINSLPMASKQLKNVLKATTDNLKEVDKKIKETLAQDEDMAENASLAMSVPGISYISAAAIILDTQNFTRFVNPRKYASHTGCVPYKHESGTSVRRRPRVSKASNRNINTLLTQGAVSLMTHNLKTKEYVKKKRMEGKHTGCIINNIRNKMIHRVFAVIRHHRPFDPTFEYGKQMAS